MKQWNKTLFLLVFICVLGCKEGKMQTENKEVDSREKIENEIDQNIVSENEDWMKSINLRSDTLQNLYTENAIKIIPNSQPIIGKNAIKDYHLSKNIDVLSIYSDTFIQANQKRAIEYELGGFNDENNKKYKHIIIWKTTNGQRKRELEFVVDERSPEGIEEDIDEIVERRNQWMKLCNAHDAKALIYEMYSDNTLYYNHKPLIVGRDLLVEEYQYMNNENYSLTLTPIVSEQVNEEFVFEIGQCSGGYNGKYIIIWRKSKSNKWEVFIDSNI